MSETLRDLVVSLSLQSDSFTRNIKSVQKQMQEAESEFKLAAAGVDKFEASTTGMATKLSYLEGNLANQTKLVDQYAKALEQAEQKLIETKRNYDDYSNRLSTAESAYGETLDEANAKLNERYELVQWLTDNGYDESTIQAAQEAADAEREHVNTLSLLTGQVEREHNAMRNAADAVTDHSKKLNNAKTAYKETEAEIEKARQELALLQTEWNSAGQTMTQNKQAIDGIAKSMKLAESEYELAAAGVKNFDTSTAGMTAKLGLLQEKLTLQNKSLKEYESTLEAARTRLKAASDAHDPEKIREATEEVKDAEIALNKAKATIKETEAAIKKQNQALANVNWSNAAKGLESYAKVATKVGKTLSVAVTTPIVALAKESIEASIDFESSFTSVRKTVNATEAEFEQLERAAKEMSTQVATSVSDINEIMATGGQLGISTENLEEFTRVIIDLSNSAEDLDADTAATKLAQLMNVMGTDQSDIDRLASVIVELGNNFATTEEPIVEMAQKLSGAGKQVGLTEAEVLAFATALSSVGIEAGVGGTTFSKALTKMAVASANGGQALTDFAQITGMTEEGFKNLFDTDPAEAFIAFISGLAQLDEEGESAITTLSEIGMSEVRLRDTLLRSTNAVDLFKSALEMADNEWNTNTALTEEANKRYSTLESKFTNIKNKALNLAATIGDDLAPTINNILDGISNFVEGFNSLDEGTRQGIEGMLAFAAAVGPVLLATGKVAGGVSKIITMLDKLAPLLGVSSTGTLVAGIGVVAGLAAVTAGLVKLYKTYDKSDIGTKVDKLLQNTDKDITNNITVKLNATAELYGSDGEKTFKEEITSQLPSIYDSMRDALTDGKPDTQNVLDDQEDTIRAYYQSAVDKVNEWRAEEIANLDTTAADFETSVDTINAKADEAIEHLHALSDESVEWLYDNANKATSTVKNNMTQLAEIEEEARRIINEIDEMVTSGETKLTQAQLAKHALIINGTTTNSEAIIEDVSVGYGIWTTKEQTAADEKAQKLAQINDLLARGYINEEQYADELEYINRVYDQAVTAANTELLEYVAPDIRAMLLSTATWNAEDFLNMFDFSVWANGLAQGVLTDGVAAINNIDFNTLNNSFIQALIESLNGTASNPEEIAGTLQAWASGDPAGLAEFLTNLAQQAEEEAAETLVQNAEYGQNDELLAALANQIYDTYGIDLLASMDGNQKAQLLAGIYSGDTTSTPTVNPNESAFRKYLIDEAGKNTALKSALASLFGVDDINEYLTNSSFSDTSLAQMLIDNAGFYDDVDLAAIVEAGQNYANGFIDGIGEKDEEAYAAGRHLALEADRGAREALQIESPSKVMKRAGGYVAEGFALGITGGKKDVTSAMNAIIDTERLTNAQKYLGGQSNSGVAYAGAYGVTNNTTNNDTVDVSGNTFVIRDKLDINSLAIQLSDYMARRRRGRGSL